MSKDFLSEIHTAFHDLLNTVVQLRGENGCPWDKKQTPESFHHHILEEYHEFVEALGTNNSVEIVDEMGDLFFLVLLLGYMLDQNEVARFANVMQHAREKMVRRHPHVFGDAVAETPDDVVRNWREIKESEENIKKRDSLLDGIPRSLPALSRAQKLARRASRVGFDWTGPGEVFPKIDEELSELKMAVSKNDKKNIQEELGDVLFVITNAARLLEIDAEAALNSASDKFERRFRYIEAGLRNQDKRIEHSSLAEMDKLWDEAKQQEKD